MLLNTCCACTWVRIPLFLNMLLVPVAVVRTGLANSKCTWLCRSLNLFCWNFSTKMMTKRDHGWCLKNWVTSLRWLNWQKQWISFLYCRTEFMVEASLSFVPVLQPSLTLTSLCAAALLTYTDLHKEASPGFCHGDPSCTYRLWHHTLSLQSDMFEL